MKIQQLFVLLAVQAIGVVFAAPTAAPAGDKFPETLSREGTFKTDFVTDAATLEKKEVAEVWANWYI